jgi:hypothetical protein
MYITVGKDRPGEVLMCITVGKDRPGEVLMYITVGKRQARRGPNDSLSLRLPEFPDSRHVKVPTLSGICTDLL